MILQSSKYGNQTKIGCQSRKIILIKRRIGIRIEKDELSVHRLDTENEFSDIENMQVYEIKVFSILKCSQ